MGPPARAGALAIRRGNLLRTFAYNVHRRGRTGLDIGGYQERPDWPKMGPSLLIATCLIVAIRTAKWPVRKDQHLSSRDLDEEIEFAAAMARRVMAHLMATCETIFPRRREPWYQANDEEVPK